jgi:hypothetical protein
MKKSLSLLSILAAGALLTGPAMNASADLGDPATATNHWNVTVGSDSIRDPNGHYKVVFDLLPGTIDDNRDKDQPGVIWVKYDEGRDVAEFYHNGSWQRVCFDPYLPVTALQGSLASEVVTPQDGSAKTIVHTPDGDFCLAVRQVAWDGDQTGAMLVYLRNTSNAKAIVPPEGYVQKGFVACVGTHTDPRGFAKDNWASAAEASITPVDADVDADVDAAE